MIWSSLTLARLLKKGLAPICFFDFERFFDLRLRKEELLSTCIDLAYVECLIIGPFTSKRGISLRLRILAAMWQSGAHRCIPFRSIDD